MYIRFQCISEIGGNSEKWCYGRLPHRSVAQNRYMNLTIALLPGLGVIELILILVILAGMGFWVWMIVDCAKHETSSTQKLIWLIVIILFWILGAGLYFLVRKLPRIPTSPPQLQ